MEGEEVVEGVVVVEVVVDVRADVFSKHRDEQHLVPGVQVHVVAAAGHAGIDFQQTSIQLPLGLQGEGLQGCQAGYPAGHSPCHPQS